MKTKLIIFGITGDLSTRKLLPVLKDIVDTGEYEDLSVIGVSRRQVDTAELLSAQPVLIDRTSIFTMDLADKSAYVRLKESVDLQQDEQALVYLSVPPSAAADIVDFLGMAGFTTANVKILFEKPFGFDLTSAEEVITRSSRYFTEDQLYRIDHYMAKEVAQDIIRMRTTAESHDTWDNQSITKIEIIASEKIGVEGRGTFYEQTGALRDFIQGHLMQLLSLVLMETPSDFSMEKLPIYRLEALNRIQPADPVLARRAQYRGYSEEVGNPGGLTETFASLELSSDDSRWQGVSLQLTTGKALSEKRSFIKITQADGKVTILEEGASNKGGRLPDAYERVLIEAIHGRKSIFTTSPEVLQSWKIVAPVQQAWSMDNQPLPLYTPGTSYTDLIA